MRTIDRRSLLVVTAATALAATALAHATAPDPVVALYAERQRLERLALDAANAKDEEWASPMWWASNKSSDRYADKWLRQQFKIPSGTVQTANSLKGAALIQGHMLAVRIRERSPTLPITEAHPKALLKALNLRSWEDISKAFSISGAEPNEHERDAVLAAVAAREGFCGRWPVDLSQTRESSEQDTSKLAFGIVNYWWPMQQPIAG